MPILLIILLIFILPLAFAIGLMIWLLIIAAAIFFGLLIAALACFANGLTIVGVVLLVVDVLFLLGGISYLIKNSDNN